MNARQCRTDRKKGGELESIGGQGKVFSAVFLLPDSLTFYRGWDRNITACTVSLSGMQSPEEQVFLWKEPKSKMKWNVPGMCLCQQKQQEGRNTNGFFANARGNSNTCR